MKPASSYRLATLRRWPHGIVHVLRDAPLRARMGQAGLARVRSSFSASRMVQETLDVYARLVDRRRAEGSAPSRCGRLKPHAFSIPR